MDIMHKTDETLVQKWGPVLEGIDNEYTRRVTAQLLENQAKAVVEEKINEDISAAATTTGRLGTFQKFAFPLVRRVYPALIANNLVAVQPMQGPVSQVFYIGNSRYGWHGIPYTESLALFTALRRRGVPARLVLFPDDGHWPSWVKSMPLYYAAHLDWFHRYLGGDPCPYDLREMVRGRAFDEGGRGDAGPGKKTGGKKAKR